MISFSIQRGWISRLYETVETTSPRHKVSAADNVWGMVLVSQHKVQQKTLQPPMTTSPSDQAARCSVSMATVALLVAVYHFSWALQRKFWPVYNLLSVLFICEMCECLGGWSAPEWSAASTTSSFLAKHNTFLSPCHHLFSALMVT